MCLICVYVVGAVLRFVIAIDWWFAKWLCVGCSGAVASCLLLWVVVFAFVFWCFVLLVLGFGFTL